MDEGCYRYFQSAFDTASEDVLPPFAGREWLPQPLDVRRLLTARVQEAIRGADAALEASVVESADPRAESSTADSHDACTAGGLPTADSHGASTGQNGGGEPAAYDGRGGMISSRRRTAGT